jgi:lipopolysaccharide export system permease protein
MMRASTSSVSCRWVTALTLPAVPTGMKIGVEIAPWSVWMSPARADVPVSVCWRSKLSRGMAASYISKAFLGQGTGMHADECVNSRHMNKLDRYILRQFLSTFFFSIVLLTVISTVIDLSERTDDFARSGLTTRQIIEQYYFGFVPYIMAMLFPLFVFISVIFFTSKMANRTEFVAMLASGISLRRILRPYLVGGILLGGILWWGYLALIPRANDIRATFDLKYLRSGPMAQGPSNSYYMRVDSFSYCGIRYYDTVSKNGGGFFMETIRGNRITYNLRADNIIWDTAK